MVLTASTLSWEGVMRAINESALILLAPFALFLGALLQLPLARLCSSRVKGILATIFCVPAVLAVAALIPSVQSGHALDVNLFSWDGPLVAALHVDALSVLFALMGTCLGAIVLLYSVGYMGHDRAATRFYATMLIFIGGFVCFVYCANLFLLYLCWEIIGLCSFSLVGFWYQQREAVMGARKVLVMTHVAGYGLLAAVLILYHRAGSALWTDPAVARGFSAGVFLLMLVALIAKSVQVPLHTWIPDAMAAPTPVSSLLHAACYVTAGVYLAARMHSFGPWAPVWSAALVSIGTVTMVVGVIYAMVQTDLKRMLAFSTVSQIGYMMLGIGIGTPLAMTAGLLHCLNHGFFKGGLFLNAGAVQHAAGTRDMNELGGLAQRMPRTTMCWLMGVGSMAGLPLMSGFVSKWMLYAAALQAGWAVPALVAWIVSLGTVFLCAKATSAVFLGPVSEHTRDAHEATWAMQWAMGLMAVGNVALGVAPQLAVNYLFNPILSALGLGTAMQVSWFGMFAGAGSFSTTGGLVLALVSLVAGGAIYAFAYFVRTSGAHTVVAAGSGGAAALAGGGVFTGGEPISGEGRLSARDFSAIFEQNWKPFFRWSNVDGVYLKLWAVLRSSSVALDRAIRWMERRAALLLVLMATGLLLSVRWFAPGAALHAAVPRAVPLMLIAAVALAVLGLVLAALLDRTMRRSAPAMLLVGAAVVGGLIAQSPWTRLGLIEAGALLSAYLVWLCARERSTKLLYLGAVLLSGSALLAAEFLTDHGQPEWGRAFLLAGACIKLAAVPFFLWLLRLADELPAVVLGLIVAVVDLGAFAELYVLAQSSPEAFLPHSVWLVFAVATSLIAALLMLGTQSLKRLLVLSTVEDIGFLMLGIVSASAIGLSGTLFAAATHALAKALLFACLSSPESNGALDGLPAGLAAKYPVSAFGFLFGFLAMLGVPPTVGFVGRWKLYTTALEVSPALLAAFLLASALALIAYVRALSQFWWGPAPNAAAADGAPAPATRPEPLVLSAVVIGFVVLVVAGGLWPQAVEHLLGGGGL
jgi:NADH:ubiquinone oxidoreductase subunit 5 (subunit L)/multisubunit Na+/H+ antiporter MnhA subunit